MSLQSSRKFILAGNAVFTVRSHHTGKHCAFRIGGVMNIFLLHSDPATSASYLVDDHVAHVTVYTRRTPLRSCKMALDACQM